MVVRSVDIEKLRDVQSEVRSKGSTIRGELRGLRASFQNVVQSADMQGGAKNAFNGNVINVHIPILNGLEELYHELDDTLTSVIRHVRDAGPESAANGVVATSILGTYSEAVEARDNRLQVANDVYRGAYNVVGGLPNEFRPAVQMPSTETYDSILFRYGFEIRQMERSLENLSIDFTSLTDLTCLVRTEVDRVREHVLCYVGSEFVIPTNPDFAAEMAELRRARQDSAFAGPMTIYGMQGGWCEHSRSYFDDQAFDEFVAQRDLWADKDIDELYEVFGLDEYGNIMFDDDGNAILNWDAVQFALRQPYDRITDEQWAVLYGILVNLESDSDITRFFQSLQHAIEKTTGLEPGQATRRVNQDITSFHLNEFTPPAFNLRESVASNMRDEVGGTTTGLLIGLLPGGGTVHTAVGFAVNTGTGVAEDFQLANSRRPNRQLDAANRIETSQNTAYVSGLLYLNSTVVTHGDGAGQQTVHLYESPCTRARIRAFNEVLGFDPPLTTEYVLQNADWFYELYDDLVGTS